MVYKKMNIELSTLLTEMAQKARSAGEILNTATSNQKNKFFKYAVSAIQDDTDLILTANQVDIKAAKDNQKDAAFVDRLALDELGCREYVIPWMK